ncbi:CDP-archaeol synthase [Candidatus Peregrinibacteria bacterium]|nr:CDP-archaeol synthase [Candidatus Peregrinibacteria bacterium]
MHRKIAEARKNCNNRVMIVEALYFILPAYMANMAPLILGKLNAPLGVPINKKALGANKTWRGLYAGYLGALLVLAIQFWLGKMGYFDEYLMIDLSAANIFAYAIPFGIGAIVGDAAKSFVKRRLKIKPGAPFFPFDQIDFIIGVYIFMLPVFVIPWQAALIVLIVTPVLHFLANVIAYAIGIKKVWW